MLNRYKPELWYCKRLVDGDEGYENDGIERFSEPVKRKLNYRFMSSETILAAGGEFQSGVIIARQLRGHPDKYYEGDRVYIGIEPENFDPVSPDANFKISSVTPMHNVVEILMEKMV